MMEVAQNDQLCNTQKEIAMGEFVTGTLIPLVDDFKFKHKNSDTMETKIKKGEMENVLGKTEITEECVVQNLVPFVKIMRMPELEAAVVKTENEQKDLDLNKHGLAELETKKSECFSYTCSICYRFLKNLIKNKQKSSVKNLEKHKCFYSIIKQLKSVILQECCSEKKNLKTYHQQQLEKKNHVCGTCNKNYSKIWDLHLHQQEHSKQYSSISCEVCNKSLNIQNSYNILDLWCSETNQLNKAKLSRDTKLNKAKLSRDTKLNNDKLARDTSKKRHRTKLRVYRPNLKRFNCETCGKSYTDKSTSIFHSPCFSGIKPHTCETCNKSFFQKCQLTSHRYLHSEHKQFICATCGKSFWQKNTLYRHQVDTHIPKQRHICATCGKSYNRKSSLSIHQASIHKKLKCTICKL